MQRINYLQNSFGSGRIGRRLRGQKNLDALKNGTAEQQNFLTMPFAGVTKRSGTVFINEVKNSTLPTKLMPFQFSTLQAYMIECGVGYFRFYMNSGQIQVNNAPYEVANPYTEAQIPDLKITQSNDVLYITHQDRPPAMLSRTDHTHWTYNPITFVSGPFQDLNSTDTTLTPSATTGSITLTASSDVFVATDVGRFVRYLSQTQYGYAQINSVISATEVSATVIANLDGITASKAWALGSFSVTTGYPKSAAFYEERLYFGATKAQPQTLFGSDINDFYTFTAGTNNNNAIQVTLNSDQVNAIEHIMPYKVMMLFTRGGEWSLSSSDYLNQPITPTNVRATLETTYGCSAARPVRHGNSIFFVQSAGIKLHEFVYEFENDGYIAPEISILADEITGQGIFDGCFQAQPFGLYWAIRKQDGQLIAMTWLKEQNVIAFHEHPLGGKGRVRSLGVIRNETYDQLWLIVERTIDGVVKQYIEVLDVFFNLMDKYDAHFVDSGLKYNGVQDTTLTLTPREGHLYTATVPTAQFTQSSVGQAIFELTGIGRGMITAVASPTTAFIQAELPFGQDSYGPQQWAIAVKTVTNLDHLNGCEVAILANGATRPKQVVHNGSITFDSPAYNIHVGLPYTALLETLDYEAGSAVGSSDFQKGRIFEADVHFYETLGGRYSIGHGPDTKSITYRSIEVPMNESAPLFEGTKRLKANYGFASTRKIRIMSDEPLPMTVLSINSKMQVQES